MGGETLSSIENSRKKAKQAEAEAQPISSTHRYALWNDPDRRAAAKTLLASAGETLPYLSARGATNPETLKLVEAVEVLENVHTMTPLQNAYREQPADITPKQVREAVEAVTHYAESEDVNNAGKVLMKMFIPEKVLGIHTGTLAASGGKSERGA